MSGLSHPGLPVLRNIPVWIKLVVAGAVLILPTLSSLTWLQESQRRDAQDVNSGVGSTKLVVACDKTLRDLQVLRVTTVSLASGDNRVANQFGQAEANTVLADLDTVNKAQPVEGWEAMADLIKAIINASPHMHAQESVTRYADATEKLEEYLEKLLEQTPGTHPDAGTLGCVHLGVLCQNLMRHYGVAAELIASRGALRQSLNADDQAEVIRLSALIDNDASEIDVAYRKLIDTHPNLKATLQDGADACRSSSTAFLQYVQGGVLANGGDLPTSVHTHLLSALEGNGKFLTALMEAAAQQSEARHQQVAHTLIHQQEVLAILLGVGGLVALLVLWDLAAPLHELKRVAQALSGWDFSVEVPPMQRNDEIGQIHAALQSLSDIGRDFIRSLQENAGPLAEASAQLIRGLREQSTVPQLTGGPLADATASLDRIRRSAQTVTQGLEAVGQSLQQAVQLAIASRQSADTSQQDCQHFTDQVEAVTPDALRLNESIQKLTGLINVLRESADSSTQQLGEVSSKLSWLIIESKARPHDQTGPALAAAEQAVRSFTDQSSTVVRQMRDLVTDMQHAANETAKATLEAGRRARAGLQGTSETAAAARKLANTLTTTSHVAVQTAQALPELMAEVDRLSTAFWGIRSDGSAMTQVQQTAQTQAQKVAQLTQALQGIIEPGRGPE
ncbi:MAG TPA: methyl-accepting chemotaxis protein [Candidatus Xenobia bacterium]